MASKKKLVFKPKHALDMDNSVYLHLRMEAHRRREQRDICAEHLQVGCQVSADGVNAARHPGRTA
jgi:hypothetical protein